MSRERLYLVRETLTGVAHYEVLATSKAEALRKVRGSEAGGMVHSQVDHMGTGEVELIDRRTRLPQSRSDER